MRTRPLVLAVVLTACAGAADDRESVPPAEPTGWTCAGHPVDLDALTDGPPASGLGQEGRAALHGEEVEVTDLGAWRVVEETEHRLVVVRQLDEPEDAGDGDVRTHHLVAVERFGSVDDRGRPGWHLRTSGRCTPRRDLGDVEAADVALGDDLDPTASTIPLLVTERACASGQPADGRIRVVELDQADDAVAFVIGVEPLGGEQTCPGNTVTPYTLELDAPVGDRHIEDRALHPSRRLR